MPIISKFYGMTIRMYFQQSEHNPPHIHVIYGQYIVVINILKNEVMEGELPNKKLKLVKKWIEIHRNELIYIWNNQKFKNIEPLK